MPILQTKKLHSERLSMLAQDTEWAPGHELEGIYFQTWLVLAWPEPGRGDASLRPGIPGAKWF